MERECLLSVFLWHAGVHSVCPVCLFRTCSFPQAYRWGGNWAYLSRKAFVWITGMMRPIIMIRPSLILRSRKRISLTPRMQGCIRRSWKRFLASWKSLVFPCVKAIPLCWKSQTTGWAATFIMMWWEILWTCFWRQRPMTSKEPWKLFGACFKKYARYCVWTVSPKSGLFKGRLINCWRTARLQSSSCWPDRQKIMILT